MLMAVLLIAAAVPDAPSTPQTVVDHALTDLCPRLFANSLQLADPVQLAAIGYEKGTLRGKVQFYDRKIDGHFVEISYAPEFRICWVNFAGPSIQTLFDGTEATMRRRGLVGDPAAKLGGPSRMVKLERRGSDGYLSFTQLIGVVGAGTPLSMAMLSDKQDKK